MDLQTNSRWIGSHPPLDWPLQQYSLSPRDGDPSCGNYDTLGLDPPVFDAPVYFLNLSGRQLKFITAYGRPDAPSADDREFKGFLFTFTDGSTETVDQTPTDMKAGTVEMNQNETITDLRLHFGIMANMLRSPTKLCGVQVSSFDRSHLFESEADIYCCQFVTNLDRSLMIGRTENNIFKQRSSARDREDNEAVCGLQIGLTPSGVMCMGLVFWRS